MIRKLLVIILCLTLFSCGGFSIVAGAKFKKEVFVKSNRGNPNSTTDLVKIGDKNYINFPRPIGNCGGKITFFGVLLPIIPVWFNFNSCEENFEINVSGSEVLDIKLKYRGKIEEAIAVERKSNFTHASTVYELFTTYKFKIDNFWNFRIADDKAIIISGKTKDGEIFTEELPVSWGIMQYYNWSFP